MRPWSQFRKWVRTLGGFWKAFLAIVVMVGVALSALFASGAMASSSHGARTMTAVAIDRLAVKIAAADGDLNPLSVTWVRSNREAANAEIGAEVGPATVTVPVYVIQIHGVFRVNHSEPPPPPGEKPGPAKPTTYLWIVIDRKTGRTTDFGTSDRPANLGALGTTETDSL